MSEPGLPFAVRALFAVSSAAIRLRLMPKPVSTIAKPAAKRQQVKPAWFMSRPMSRDVTIAEETIRTRSGPMRVRVYRPVRCIEGPAILYIHGGGFVLGGLDACKWICAELAVRTGCVVVANEYRLAPEDRFPAGLEDCVDALAWLAGGGVPGVDPERIAVAGDSAGGNLAAALALVARDGEAPTFRHQTLIYPFLDSTLSGESWVSCAGGGLDVDAGRAMLTWYVGDTGWDDPRVSPLSAADFTGLPPALVLTADRDVLRDDGKAYAEKLLSAGVPTRYLNYPGMPHGFLSLARLCKPSTEALTEIATAIASALDVPDNSREPVS